jgi:hypothetical protein
MAIIRCPNCKKLINDKHGVCMRCKAELPTKIKRGLCDKDYTFCTVSFGTEKTYSYLTDVALSVGDIVVVPVGEQNEHKTATVVSVQKYFKGERPPYPLDKVKKVIKKGSLE